MYRERFPCTNSVLMKQCSFPLALALILVEWLARNSPGCSCPRGLFKDHSGRWYHGKVTLSQCLTCGLSISHHLCCTDLQTHRECSAVSVDAVAEMAELPFLIGRSGLIQGSPQFPWIGHSDTMEPWNCLWWYNTALFGENVHLTLWDWQMYFTSNLSQIWAWTSRAIIH